MSAAGVVQVGLDHRCASLATLGEAHIRRHDSALAGLRARCERAVAEAGAIVENELGSWLAWVNARQGGGLGGWRRRGEQVG